jgi:hypothetical protein
MAENIEIDKTYMVNLRLAKIDSFQCINQPKTALKGLWYALNGQDKIISIDNLPNNLQVQVFEGNCEQLVCVESSQGKFFAKKGNTYKILIGSSTFEFFEPTFEINFQESEAASFSQCSSPLILECDTTLAVQVSGLLSFSIPNFAWIKIEGDGQNKIINFQSNNFNIDRIILFNGNCDTLKFIKQFYYTSSISFPTNANTDILIGVSNSLDYKVELSCEHNQNLSNVCSRAEFLKCEDHYSRTITPNNFSNLESDNQGGFWFKSEIGKKKHIFKQTGQNTSGIGLKIYKSSNSGCVDAVFFLDNNNLTTSSDIIVNTYEGERLYVKYYGPLGGQIDFVYSCSNNHDQNFDCTSANQLLCNDTLNLYFLPYDNEWICNKYEQKGFWYELMGSKNVIELESLSDNVILKGTIYKYDCDTLQCLNDLSFDFNNGRKYQIKTNENERYFLKLSVQYMNDNQALITTRCVVPHENNFCETANDISCSAPEILESTLIGYIVGDSIDHFGSYWYKFVGDGRELSIRSNEYFTFDIYEGSCENNRRINNYFLNTSIPNQKLSTKDGQIYFIRIYKELHINTISFSFSCEDPPLNKICTNAELLQCNTNYILKFGSLTNTFWQYCDTTDRIWYKIIGDDKLINLISEFGSEMQSFEGPCDSLQCISAGNSILNFYGVKNKEYYIQINNVFVASGLLRVACFDVEKNTCDSPKNIACGDSLLINFQRATSVPAQRLSNPELEYWVEFEGNDLTYNFNPIYFDQVLNFRYEVFVDNCDSIIDQINPYTSSFGFSSFSIATKIGRKYKVRFSSNGFINPFEIYISPTILISCMQTPSHQSCGDALPIECGLNYTYDPASRGNSYLNYFNKFRVSWYKIEGNDQLSRIIYETNGSTQLNYVLYQSISECDSLLGLSRYIGFNDNGSFYLEKGRTYYLELFTDPIVFDITPINFTIDCQDFVRGPNCKEAIPINCGDSLNITNLGNEQNIIGDCTAPSSGVWLQFKGDGKVKNISFRKLEFDSRDMNLSILVGEGKCDTIQCTEMFVVDNFNRNISFKTEINKDYFIKINHTFSFASFVASLNITCDEISENFNCDAALPFECGQTLTGNTAQLPNDIKNPCNDTLPGLYYHFVGDGNQIKFTEIASQFSYLSIDVFENSCKNNGRCLYKVSVNNYDNNSFVLETKAGKSYYLKISTGQNNPASFRFVTECIIAPKNTSCRDAQDIYCDEVITTQLVTPIGSLPGSLCGSFTSSKGYWFRLPKTNQLIELKFDNLANFNVAVVAGVCNQINCTSSASILANSIIVENSDPIDQYIHISSKFKSFEEVSFEVNCKDKLSYDDCATPLMVQCDEIITTDYSKTTFSAGGYCSNNSGQKDVWFEMIGDGNLRTLSFEIEGSSFSGAVGLYSKGNCEALTCLKSKFIYNSNEDNNFTFSTEIGNSYLINLVSFSNIPEVKMKVYCEAPAVNDKCIDALPLFTNDSIFVNFAGGSADVESNCLSHFENTIWYKIIGNDSIISIQSPTLDVDLNITVFENCSNISTCVISGNLRYTPQIKFVTEKGKEYYIAFSGKNNNITTKSYYFAKHSSCLDAHPIQCNDAATVNTENFFYNENQAWCGNPNEINSWFVLTGNGRNVIFNFEASPVFATVDILTQCYSSCVYRHQIYENTPTHFELETENDKKYFIKINLNTQQTSQRSLNFYTQCVEGVSNISYESAEPLQCGNLTVDASLRRVSVDLGCRGYRTEYYYYFIGNGDELKIKKDRFGPDVEISDRFCGIIYNFTENDTTFVTNLDQKYYLVVSHAAHIRNETFKINVDYNCTSAALLSNQQWSNDVKVYPNPFSQDVSISLQSKQSQIGNIEILDPTGKIVKSKTYNFILGENQIKLEKEYFQNNGVHLIRLKTNKGSKLVKVIKIE